MVDQPAMEAINMDDFSELHDIPISGCRDAQPPSLFDLGHMRLRVRELRKTARRVSEEAWLLERAVDGALALAILDAAPRRSR
jgi:hypothetical protein